MNQLQHLVITTINIIISLLNLREWFIEFISIRILYDFQS